MSAWAHAYRGVPVLVLGASGFVGRWVARALSQAGADLGFAVRDVAALEGLRAPYGLAGRSFTADLTRAGAVEDLCATLRPAVVFNLAGYGVDPAEREDALAWKLNRDVPAALARALSEPAPGWTGRRVVHAGSALEYGPVKGRVHEGLASNPTTLYGRSTVGGAVALAAAAREAGLRAVEGRIFTAYGPGEHPTRLLPALLAARASGEALALTDGRQQRDFVHVEDVAEALLRLGADSREGFESVQIASGTLRSVREFVTIAARVLGIGAERLDFGARPHLAEEMWHGEVSVERLRERVGWTPATTLEQGIEATRRAVDEEGLR